MNKPLCFIIMPFGKKKYRLKDARDGEWFDIDFNRVYEELIKPGVVGADMEPIRADEEKTRGIIHKPMFERILLSDYVVADLTGANANVFYELGIRHAVKPYTTITIFAANSELPFDLNSVRTAPYNIAADGAISNKQAIIQIITDGLKDAKTNKTTDSPVYQLVDGIHFQNSLAHEKTDIFRDKVVYNETLKEQLAQARETKGSKAEKIAAVDAIAASLAPENEEAGVLIDVMLSYRALGAFEKMIDFIRVLPPHVQQTVMVQEQLGFALNRAGKKEEGIRVLEKVVKDHGPSSETYGILGRVYKDLFDKACEEGNDFLADVNLDKALETYRSGFEADWRDAYPGVNAVTLLELKGDKDQVQKLSPVVEYAVQRKLSAKTPDYWDYATLLELAVIENDEKKAVEQLKKALACKIEGEWMFDTTLKNLSLINRYRQKRGENTSVSEKLIALLNGQKEAMQKQST